MQEYDIEGAKARTSLRKASRVILEEWAIRLLKQTWAQGDKIKMFERHLRWYQMFAWGFLATSLAFLILLFLVIFR